MLFFLREGYAFLFLESIADLTDDESCGRENFYFDHRIFHLTSEMPAVGDRIQFPVTVGVTVARVFGGIYRHESAVEQNRSELSKLRL